MTVRPAAVSMIAMAFLDAVENAHDMYFEYCADRDVWLLDGFYWHGGRDGYAFESIANRDPGDALDYVAAQETYRREWDEPVVDARSITPAELRIGLMHGISGTPTHLQVRAIHRRRLPAGYRRRLITVDGFRYSQGAN